MDDSNYYSALDAELEKAFELDDSDFDIDEFEKEFESDDPDISDDYIFVPYLGQCYFEDDVFLLPISNGKTKSTWKYYANLSKKDIEFLKEKYKEEISNGSTAAKYNMGRLLIRDRTTAETITAGFDFFRQAAEEGFPAAQYIYGLRIYDICGDKNKALRWWVKAADQGISRAVFLVDLFLQELKSIHGETFDADLWLANFKAAVYNEKTYINSVYDYFSDQKTCNTLDNALECLSKLDLSEDFLCQILLAYQLWIHGSFYEATFKIDENIKYFNSSLLSNDYKIYVENVGKRYSVLAGVVLATAASALDPEIFDYVKKNSNLSPETWIVLSQFVKNSKDLYQFCLRMAFKRGYHPCPNYIDGILSENVRTHIDELEKKLQGEIEYRQRELYFNNAGYLADTDYFILLKRISENTYNYYYVLTRFKKRYPDECEALLSILWDDKKSLIPVMKKICGTGYEYLLSTTMSSFLYQTITDFFFENPEEGTTAIWKFLGTASIHQDELVRRRVIWIANLTSILQDLINRAEWKLNLSNEDYLRFEWRQNSKKPHRDFSGYGRSLLEYDQEIKKGIRDAERFKEIITKTYKDNDKPLIKFIDYTAQLLKDYSDATHNYLGLMKGYRGEKAVYEYLKEYCSSWIILKNINVPVDEEQSDSVENDFVALGNGGIFSIEVKNYSNKTITISKDGMVSGQEFGNKKQSSKNIVTQMSRHEAYLAKYLQENYDDKTIDFDQYVKSIAVISNHEDSLTINNETDLKIVRLQMLRKTLTGHVIPNPLSKEQLSEIAEVLKNGSLPDKKYEFIDVGLAWCWRSKYRDIAEAISEAVSFFSKS